MEDVRMEMLKMWKTSRESYVKTLTMMQEQGERMCDLFLNQSDSVRDEAQRIIKEGMTTTKEAQKNYVKAVEENVAKMEELLSKKE